VVGADNKVTQRTIKVLETVKEKVIVESGLSAGEKIILEGLLKVHPGDKVILVSEKSR
jgi:membrane fusion protein (multidrug efflux system)